MLCCVALLAAIVSVLLFGSETRVWLVFTHRAQHNTTWVAREEIDSSAVQEEREEYGYYSHWNDVLGDPSHWILVGLAEDAVRTPPQERSEVT